MSSLQLFKRLLTFVRPYRNPMAIAMVCMVILGACTASVAWMLKPALDEVMAGNIDYVYLIPAAIILIYLIKGAAYYGQSYLMGMIGQRIIFDLRNMLYNRITTQSLAFFAHRKTGEILARLSYDITLVQASVSSAITSLMRDFVTAIFLLVVIFVRDPVLACIAIFILPAVIYPIVRFGKKMRKATLDGQVSMGAFSALVEETVGGIRVVKAFGMEGYEQKRFMQLASDFLKHQLRVVRVQSLSFPIMELLAGFGIAGVLFYGGMRIASGETTAGTLMSFLAAMMMLYDPVKRLSRTNNEIQAGLAAAERVFEVVDEPIAVQDKIDATLLPCFSQNIRFDQVSLCYQNAKRDVLTAIDFNVDCGQVVALVGRSGAGKSSLVNLVPRFLDATSGHVLIDGYNIRDVTQCSLRQNIAMVTQDITLFNDTVLNNITYGHPESDRQRVIDAAKAANAHEFIMALPKGYDSEVGERGVILSGGQRQRISLARALHKDAPILILDEATSSLDSESERLVQQAIDRLMMGRTVIVIAHRLSTVRHADRILVLDAGRIVQTGSHDTLMQEGGLYEELYTLQFETADNA
ncbi:MAG: ABC transporter ATP-binding protein [Mariprofundaceae bacterium]